MKKINYSSQNQHNIGYSKPADIVHFIYIMQNSTNLINVMDI